MPRLRLEWYIGAIALDVTTSSYTNAHKTAASVFGNEMVRISILANLDFPSDTLHGESLALYTNAVHTNLRLSSVKVELSNFDRHQA